jgi:hypothetical protein
MPVFIAFAVFLLVVFGHRLGLPIAPWVVTTGPFGRKRKSPGQKSGVRTDTIEMVLDHDSGRRGRVRACIRHHHGVEKEPVSARHQAIALSGMPKQRTGSVRSFDVGVPNLAQLNRRCCVVRRNANSTRKVRKARNAYSHLQR